MSIKKFSGALKEISSRHPYVDVADSLEVELSIPRFKAEALAKRVEERYLQKIPVSGEQRVQRLFEEQNQSGPQLRTSGYCVDCLSEKEFRTFICWMLEELGYKLETEKSDSGFGFEAVANKDNEKVAVQAVKMPRTSVVSNLIVPLSEELRRKHGCSRSIVIATGVFSQKADEEAQKLNVELWDRIALNERISQAKTKCETEALSRFPPYQGTLFDSLLKLEEGKDFLVELKADWKYELLLPGVKYPLLSFQMRNGTVTRCVLRIKYNEPVSENEGEVVIGADEAGNRVGPDEAEAYILVTQYLEQFLE